MSRETYTVDVVVRLAIVAEAGSIIAELIGDMDYSFRSNTPLVEIVDTELVHHFVNDSE